MIWIVEDILYAGVETAYFGLVVADSAQTARVQASRRWPDVDRPHVTKLVYARRDQLHAVMANPLELARAAAQNACVAIAGPDELSVPRQSLLDTLDAIGARFDSPGMWAGVAGQLRQDLDDVREELDDIRGHDDRLPQLGAWGTDE